MSVPNWTPKFRGLLQSLSPELVEELDGLAAYLKGQFTALATAAPQTSVQAERGLEDHTTTHQPPPGGQNPDSPQPPGEGGIRWMVGPWLLNADGTAGGRAAIHTPQLTSNVNDWAPSGIDNAIQVSIEADAAHTITGIRIKARQRRWLVLHNRSGFTVSLKNQATESLNVHQFSWGSTGDAGETLGIPPNQQVWLWYDVHSQKWTLFGIPAVGSDNLPPSLSPSAIQTLTGFESAIYTDGATFQAVAEPAPTVLNSVSATTNLDEGHARAFFTGNVAGASAGLHFGGGAGGSCNLSQQPCWRILFRTDSSIAATRLWFILSDQTPGASSVGNADSQSGNYIGFRYSSVAGDTNWQGVTRDGSTQSTVDTGVAVAAATVYLLKVRYSVADSKLYFSVNSEDPADEVELSANIPATSTALAWTWRVIATTGTGKAMDFFRSTLRRGSTPADSIPTETSTNQYLPAASVPKGA